VKQKSFVARISLTKIFLTSLVLCLCFLVSLQDAYGFKFSWRIPFEDKRKLNIAESLANKGKFSQALNNLHNITDKDVKTAILWWKLYRSEENSFKEIADFINNNPDFPALSRLLIKAEKAIDETMPPSDVIRWFSNKKLISDKPNNGGANTGGNTGSTPPPSATTGDSLGNIKDDATILREPITANGKLMLARAILASQAKNLETNKELAKQVASLIKLSWIEGKYNSEEIRKFLKEYGKYITAQDNNLKASWLLWQNRITETKQILRYTSINYRALFEARIALKTKKSGVDGYIRKLPSYLLKNEGLIYDRASWKLANNRTQEAFEMVKSLNLGADDEGAIITSVSAIKWWDFKEKLAKKLISEKRYKEAYRLIKNHKIAKNNSARANAEWLSGWINYYYLQDYRTAYSHFYKMYKTVSMPVSLGRASYWAGRSAAKNNNPKIAEEWFKVSSKYPTSFYGQLALHKINNNNFELPQMPTPTWEDKKQYRDNKLIKTAYIFSLINKDDYARMFIKQAVKLANTPGEQFLIAKFGLDINQFSYAVTAGKASVFYHGTILIDFNYPRFKNLQNANSLPITKPESALIHSIIMQESGFNKSAVSSAGARGMMQLMPTTAKQVAKWENLPYSKNRLLTDIRYNITLGSRYLQKRIEDFGGSYILAVAAYNGGAGNVSKWMKTNGDPRHLQNPDDIANWIELIPFEETRNYVMRVLEKLQLYRFALDRRKAKIQTAQDIKRGSK